MEMYELIALTELAGEAKALRQIADKIYGYRDVAPSKETCELIRDLYLLADKVYIKLAGEVQRESVRHD